MQIQFAIEGELQLSRRLSNIAANARDWSPAFEKSVADMKELFSGPVFETEGRAVDESWSPLSRAYALQKRKKFGDAGILQASGAMRAAFATKFDATSGSIWNTASYFKYHQSRMPRTKMPRRVMMKLTENVKQMIVKNFQQYFLDTVVQ